MCEAAGLRVWVELAHLPRPAEVAALRLLDDLPLSEDQRQLARNLAAHLEANEGAWAVFLHVPYFMVLGTKL